MACAELTAFRTAVESLDQRVLRSPRLGRAMFWRNMIPRGTFVKNQGVTRSTFTIKATEPQDDQSLWYAVTLSSGQPNNACDTNFEDVNVNYYERTYGPKKRRFRGPVICKENLTFQHAPERFLNSYVDEMGRLMARVQEFTLRGDYTTFVPWFVDGVKYVGPSAISSAARAFEGPSLDRLQDMAVELINVGGGSEPDGGYTTMGPDGPQFPVESSLELANQLLKANATIRSDSQFASEGLDNKGDFSLWRAMGATRTFGNFRLVPIPTAIRLDYTGGAYVARSPFKDVTNVGTDGVILSDQYKNAAFEAAVVLSPNVFTAEIVTPTNWQFPDTSNYNGEWDFITGGERVCTPAVYDPLHEKGRHFAKLEYAPRPDYPFLGGVYVYKRCATTKQTIFCS